MDAQKPFAGLSPTMNHDAFDLSGAVSVDLLMEGGAMGSMNSAIVDGKKLDWPQLIEMQRVWAFNGVAGDLDKPLLTARRGQAVIVNMINRTRWEHAMHLHGHHFKVVSRDGVNTTDAPGVTPLLSALIKSFRWPLLPIIPANGCSIAI